MKSASVLAVFLILPMFAGAQTADLLKKVPATDAVKSVSDSVSSSLPSLLQSQLGVSKDQAEGGLGSLLSLASENLDAGDFDKLKGLIPGAAGYIDAAKNLGALSGPLKNLDGLNAALAKLGISPEVVAKFVPAVSDYLGKLGGEDAMKLLQSALGS